MGYLLHHSVDDSAMRLPDHHAMRFEGKHLTYTELAQRSNQLAHFLREQGIRPKDRVGVFLDKSLETAIAVYGIMKAGAAYVPLDPRSPSARLISIIEDCELRGIVAQDNKLKVLQEVAQGQSILRFVVGMTTDALPNIAAYGWDVVATLPNESAPRVPTIESDLAYIMYTSGSTGKPKGMMHTHYSGLSYARISSATYGVTQQDRLGNHSPLHFDMSTFEYLTGPYCGATTIIIPETYTLFPVNLAQLIEDERITIWYSVPFALIQLLQRGAMEKRDLSSIRWINYGGEPFAISHLRDLMQRLPNARISNVYGPAETNQCTYYHLTAADVQDDDASIPIGHISDNAEGLILDDADQEAAFGEVGELVVRAPTMMRGYWNRVDLNQRAFYVREVFPDYREQFYRTGDLVRQRPDGLLEFLGRKDNQVKVRGYRVELSEVEAALARHPAVEEAISFVLKAPLGDQLGAAVILRANTSATSAELTAHVRERVPPYMVPDTIETMESFPRGGTGKIDRKVVQQQVQSKLQL
jgi:amino acid adenylation domain-containing protein